MAPRTRLRIAAATAAAVLALGVVLTFIVVDALDEERTVSVERAHDARLEALQLQVTFMTRIASSRGYLLSGDEELLLARGRARDAFSGHLATIRGHHPAVAAQLAPIDDRLARLDAVSDVAVAARDVELWQQGALPMQEQILAMVRAAITTAEGELVRARGDAAAAAQRGRLTLGALAVASGTALALLVLLVVRGSQELIRGALRAKERELLQILEEVPVGVAVRTPDGSPYYLNRAGRELFGPSEADGRHALFEAGTDQRYPFERTPMSRALAGESIEVSDMEIRRDGASIPLHVRGGVVRAPDGSISYAMAVFQDARELHRHAMRDSLTGLANRASAHQTFRRDRQVAARGGRSLSVAVIDLDHFKSINDVHGHAMGDRVLQAVSTTIVESLRAADVVARWGGEELVVIMPDTDLLGGRRAIDKALAAVRGITFIGGDKEPFGVTFSAGVAVTRLGESLESVVARADAALYKAKRQGRDRVLDERTAKTGVVSVTFAEQPELAELN